MALTVHYTRAERRWKGIDFITVTTTPDDNGLRTDDQAAVTITDASYVSDDIPQKRQ
jgi:hypothetical protein